VELSCESEFLNRGDAANGHIRALVVVCPEPVSGSVLHLFDGIEQSLIEPVVAHGSVVTFNVSVLLRLAGLDVGELDATLLCPSLQGALRYSGPLSQRIACD
jgi:hypothetical protein